MSITDTSLGKSKTSHTKRLVRSVFAMINVQGIFFLLFQNISRSETARLPLRVILSKLFGVLEP